MMSYLLPARLPFPGNPPDGLAPRDEPDPISIPEAKGLDQLSQEEYNLEESAALSLGYSIATLAAQGSHDVLIFQVARYKDIGFQGQTYRFGVAIEATIVVTTTKFQGGLTLPVVAANVQMNFAAASSTLAVRGYLPQAPLQLPAWGSFDVGSYAEFQATVSKLQDNVLFDNPNIQPVLLAATQPPSADPSVKPQRGFFYELGKRV